MNRVEIKKLAKEKIKGNKWNIWWPLLIVSVISSLLSSLFGGNINYNIAQVNETLTIQAQNVSPQNAIASTVITIIISVISAGILKYILNFVRNGKFDSQDILDTIKEKWLQLLIANALTAIIVGIGFALLVIPGIILSLAYTMVDFIIIDSDIKGQDSLKKSREMMKGYKLDYFIFCLSFIGWVILGVFTLGILYIWLVPYYQVANVIYYEKLREKQA